MSSQSGGCCGGGRRERSETEQRDRAAQSRKDDNKTGKAVPSPSEKAAAVPTSTESQPPRDRRGSHCG